MKRVLTHGETVIKGMLPKKEHLINRPHTPSPVHTRINLVISERQVHIKKGCGQIRELQPVQQKTLHRQYKHT